MSTEPHPIEEVKADVLAVAGELEEHSLDATAREDTYGMTLEIVACICGEWSWDANDEHCEQRWTEHVAARVVQRLGITEVHPRRQSCAVSGCITCERQAATCPCGYSWASHEFLTIRGWRYKRLSHLCPEPSIRNDLEGN